MLPIDNSLKCHQRVYEVEKICCNVEDTVVTADLPQEYGR